MGTGCFPGVKQPGRGIDLPPRLAPTLGKEYSYSSDPNLSLRVLFKGEILYVFCRSDYVYMETGFFHVHTQGAAPCVKE